MQKNFYNWNIIKEKSHLRDSRLLFNEREIWWCRLGVNIGDEEDGKGGLFLRPVLVLRKLNKRIFFGVPLSSVIKENHSYYHKFEFKGKSQSVILAQVKLLDAKRFEEKMGAVGKGEFELIKEKCKTLMFP